MSKGPAAVDGPPPEKLSPVKAGLILLGVFAVGGAVTNAWAWLRTRPWAPDWARRNRKGGGG